MEQSGSSSGSQSAKIAEGKPSGSEPGSITGNPVSQYTKQYDAGWSSLVARRAHNPKVVGSNPAPATKHERSA